MSEDLTIALEGVVGMGDVLDNVIYKFLIFKS